MWIIPSIGAGWLFGRGGQKGQPYAGAGLGLGFPIGLSCLASEDGNNTGPQVARFAADNGAAEDAVNEMKAEAPSQSIETPGIGSPS